ncbi:MAG TPA: SEC-C metal-binding domain-containing protein [Desulfobacterales bacterium]|nr:SEC-C metal-binding domain-containing protein [Desulfobacterales bacterium]
MEHDRSKVFEAYTRRQKELAEVGKRVSGPLLLPKKIGPNEVCPCGSGKKFKKCCGED